MWSTIIVFDQPGIEIGLKLVERAIDLLPKRDPVELIEHSAMKALADSVTGMMILAPWCLPLSSESGLW